MPLRVGEEIETVSGSGPAEVRKLLTILAGLPLYPAGHPKVITLCGSTRFKEAFESEQARLTDEGHAVISVGGFGHRDGLDMAGDLKRRLDELHLRKIDMSDAVRVINEFRHHCPKCGWVDNPFYDWPAGGGAGFWKCPRAGCPEKTTPRPYMGESTRREIAYALKTGREVTYLNPPEGD